MAKKKIILEEPIEEPIEEPVEPFVSCGDCDHRFMVDTEQCPDCGYGIA